MKILVVIGPALGTINHMLALSHYLYKEGHEIIWLTGLEAKLHLRDMQSPYDTYFSQTHDLKFKANNPGNVPHFVYSCHYEYLKKTVEYELELLEKINPDLIITKHHYSPTISAKIFRIPFACYYTDGARYIFKDQNPYNRWENPEGIEDYMSVCMDLGLLCDKKEYATDYLFSPHLNIIRGVPLTSSLIEKDIQKLRNSNCVFGGMLTYDGPKSLSKSILARLPEKDPLIYATFGTHHYEKERIEILLKSLADFKGYVVISTAHFDPQDFFCDKPNVIFVKYVPNSQIVERANLVIHHAGSGTTLTCFSAGVPQIVIPNNPRYSGQVYFSETIEQRGCGKHIPYKELSVEKLKKVIEEILSNNCYQKKAEEFKKVLSREDEKCNAMLSESINKVGNSIDL